MHSVAAPHNTVGLPGVLQNILLHFDQTHNAILLQALRDALVIVLEVSAQAAAADIAVEEVGPASNAADSTLVAVEHLLAFAFVVIE